MFDTETKEIKRFWAQPTLKFERESQRVTMEVMAQKLGVSRGYYCRIENGQISINRETANKISKLLGEKPLPNN